MQKISLMQTACGLSCTYARQHVHEHVCTGTDKQSRGEAGNELLCALKCTDNKVRLQSEGHHPFRSRPNWTRVCALLRDAGDILVLKRYPPQIRTRALYDDPQQCVVCASLAKAKRIVPSSFCPFAAFGRSLCEFNVVCDAWK